MRVARGEDAAAFGGGSPSQVVITPPAPFDDRHQRDDVVRLQVGFDDEIDEAGRERAIGVAVAAIAHEPRLASRALR